MAYCANTDVASEFKSLTFSASSTPTATQITEFISQADALIDSKVGQKYETPVTAGATALLVLKMISVTLVADRVRNIIKVKTGAEPQSQEAAIGLTKKDVMDMLSELMRGQMRLEGATLRSTSDGIQSQNVTDSVAHYFKRDTDQW